MAYFDEKSGVVPCKTTWGQWWQTIDEVYIEVILESGISAKSIKCQFKPKTIKVEVKGITVIEGEFPSVIHADDAVWTLEDKKFLRICLPKGDASSGNCWKSLLVDQYLADAHTFDQMEQKVTLQKFQIENPGFDFSGASVSGNYHKGGPQLPM